MRHQPRWCHVTSRRLRPVYCDPHIYVAFLLHPNVSLLTMCLTCSALIFIFAEEGADSGSGGPAAKLTTWSNLGRQQMQLKGGQGACGGTGARGEADSEAPPPAKPERSRSRFKTEENSLNNNGATHGGSRLILTGISN